MGVVGLQLQLAIASLCQRLTRRVLQRVRLGARCTLCV